MQEEPIMTKERSGQRGKIDHRLLTTSMQGDFSHSDVMKCIDSQRYRDALDLFHRQFRISIDPTITLALKAATILRDQQSGTRIHQ